MSAVSSIRFSVAVPSNSVTVSLTSSETSTSVMSRVNRPASIWPISSRSPTSRISRSLFRLTVVRKRCCSSLSGPGSPSSRMCSQPSMAASGVRSSCDTVDTNWSFIRAAAASLRLRSAYWATCAAMVSTVSGWPSLRISSEPTS